MLLSCCSNNNGQNHMLTSNANLLRSTPICKPTLTVQGAAKATLAYAWSVDPWSECLIYPRPRWQAHVLVKHETISPSIHQYWAPREGHRHSCLHSEEPSISLRISTVCYSRDHKLCGKHRQDEVANTSTPDQRLHRSRSVACILGLSLDR